MITFTITTIIIIIIIIISIIIIIIIIIKIIITLYHLHLCNFAKGWSSFVQHLKFCKGVGCAAAQAPVSVHFTGGGRFANVCRAGPPALGCAKMEKLVELGIIQQAEGKEENLYDNILLRISRSDLSERILTASVVHSLSELVHIVKNKWQEIPNDRLSKKQFVHIVAFICDRKSTLEGQNNAKIRSIWRAETLQKELDANPNAPWQGLKYLGVKNPIEVACEVEVDNPAAGKTFFCTSATQLSLIC